MTPESTPPVSGDDDRIIGDVAVADLDGRSVDELVDYFDADFTPANPSIDNSAGCQIALAAIRRLRTLTDTFLDDEANSLPPLDETWLTGILNQISVQAQAGRDIPLGEAEREKGLVVTEGAVRAIIRSAGDNLPGLLVGRVRFTGDVTRPGEPVAVYVDATAMWGRNIPESADELKRAIDAEIRKHTRLRVTSINVTVHDIHQAPS